MSVSVGEFPGSEDLEGGKESEEAGNDSSDE